MNINTQFKVKITKCLDYNDKIAENLSTSLLMTLINNSFFISMS